MRIVLRTLGFAATIVALTMTPAAQVPMAPVIDSTRGLTIEQAIDEAVRAEPTLGAARADSSAASAERRQAGLLRNPDVLFEQRDQVAGRDRQTSVSVEWPLDLFRRGARIETADRSVGAAEAGVKEAERQVALAVREQYGRVLEAVRRLEIADEVVAASRRTYELLRGRVDEGAAPPLERDVALVELRRMEGARELAAGRLAAALSRIRRLLGRPPDAEVTLRLSLEAAIDVDRPAPAGRTVVERADIRAAEAAAAIAQARTQEARQESKPEVTVFASYMRMDQGFSQSGFNSAGQLEPVQGTFHNAAGGVRFSIPLFNRAQGTIAAARAREVAAADVLRARRLDAAGEVAAATARVDAGRRAAAAYSGEARALARRNLDVMRETYVLGRVPLFDVVNEQRRYLDFESSYTDVLAELFAAITALHGAAGDIR